jgi:hypothetical protein
MLSTFPRAISIASDCSLSHAKTPCLPAVNSINTQLNLNAGIAKQASPLPCNDLIAKKIQNIKALVVRSSGNQCLQQKNM